MVVIVYAYTNAVLFIKQLLNEIEYIGYEEILRKRYIT